MFTHWTLGRTLPPVDSGDAPPLYLGGEILFCMLHAAFSVQRSGCIWVTGERQGAGDGMLGGRWAVSSGDRNGRGVACLLGVVDMGRCELDKW